MDLNIKNTVLLDWLKSSLNDLIEQDVKIIERKLKEECINHRLALYLELNRPTDYSGPVIDIEYDKNYDQKKHIEDENGKIHLT